MNNGKDNLIPFSERSKEEARENGRKGGQASGRSRRKKADMRKAMQSLLDGSYNVKKSDGTLEEKTGAEAICLQIMKAALDPESKQWGKAVDLIVMLTGMNKTPEEIKKMKAEIKALEAKAKAYSDNDSYKPEEEIPMLYKALMANLNGEE